MKKILLPFLLMVLTAIFVYLSFSTLTPTVKENDTNLKTDYSPTKAFRHVKNISQTPHYTGADSQVEVRNYIVDELQKLDLNVHTQNGYVLNDFGVLTNPTNIVTRIDGKKPKPGGDLLVLSHYDSDPHSALGASDDAAAIAAILETLRVLKEEDFSPENNIIIAITDAEEIGLLGAELFAADHPWIDDVGFVINFEARGSGGPSNAIIETNHGNTELVKVLAKSQPKFPMTSSLMYEIYNTMPNDTDATVFREHLDLSSFFFAFIDGHYHYHSETDSSNNLDQNSMAHHASYLEVLLPFLGSYDLTTLQSIEHQVYFNFPVLKVVHYSYKLIFPLLILAWVVFTILWMLSKRYQKLNVKDFFKGLGLFLLSLIGVGVIGFLGWKAIYILYPQYQEIQQGFPYNGHTYIFSFVFLALAVFFFLYSKADNIRNRISLLFGPLFIWLVINTILAITFKGASFFIIPVFFLEIAVLLLIVKTRVNAVVLFLFAIPALFIFTPLIVFIPVALGVKIIFGAMVLSLLTFAFLLPAFIQLQGKSIFSGITFLIGIVGLIVAHFNSSFTEENPKPNSLVYLLDIDQNKAFWQTYDQQLDDWTKNFVDENDKVSDATQIMSSKYGSGFTYSKETEAKAIPGVKSNIEKEVVRDSVKYTVNISAEREIHRMNLFSKQAKEFTDFKVNDIRVENLNKRSSKIKKADARDAERLLTYYITNRDTLKLQFSVAENSTPEIEVFAGSYDLLENDWIKVPKRESNMIPKPFILNDAVITRQLITME